jgi:hypothetical protein
MVFLLRNTQQTSYRANKEEAIMTLYNYFGKKVKIVDIDNVVWIGNVVSCESPEDSEDGRWWLDIAVENKEDFGELSISDREIKSINEQ